MTFKYCPNYASVLTSSPQTDNDEAIVYRARCKQWGCDYCAEINKKVWRARIMLEVGETREVWFFWTVTLLGHDHGKGTAHSLQQWRNSWDKLMKRVKRDLGKMRYIRIFETHADGTLHVHMLCDKTYNDVKKVKEEDGRYNYRTEKLEAHLTALGLGWRHDVRPIVTSDFEDDGNARNVSAYVTKYMTKDLQSTVRSELRIAGMERVRMVQTSQGWANVPTASVKRDWTIGVLQFVAYDHYRANGFNVVDVNTGSAVKVNDFHGTNHYPNKYSDLAHIADAMETD